MRKTQGNDKRQVMSVAELAKALGIAEATVYTHIDTGNIPYPVARKIGKCVIISRSAFERWMQTGRTDEEPQQALDMKLLVHEFVAELKRYEVAQYEATRKLLEDSRDSLARKAE